MFFTRSIRRKLVIGLGLVMVMLATLFASAIDGLVSYRHMVKDLRANLNDVPHQADLVAAVGQLCQPLAGDATNPLERQIQQRLFLTQLTDSQERLLQFRLKLESLPLSTGVGERNLFVEPVLNAIAGGFSECEKWSAGLLDEKSYPHTIKTMRSIVLDLQGQALSVPEPHRSLNETLDKAEEAYRSSLLLIGISAPIILALFLGLLHCGYRWIFAPIRKLHQGARRVAQGDFSYRVKPSTNDEMAELAEAFNLMADRFQEITRDLDRQVRERSKQLVRSERLAGVGFLAAGVAHEINNPLSAIAMASESLSGRIDDLLEHPDQAETDVFRNYLEMIVREAFRCKTITEKLLNFSRGQDGVRSDQDLTGVVTEVLSMLEHVARYRDKTIIFQPEGACYIEMDGPAIKQVVLNLVANGLEAMEQAGTLKIDICEQTDHAILTVRDEGCGMTPEVLDDIFEPFFTLKQGGKGTGLGLSISHRIISEHGGTIEAASEGPGTGSTFTVRLPRKLPVRQAAAA